MNRRGTASRDALFPVAAIAVPIPLVEAPHGGATAAPARRDRVNDEHRSFPFRGTSVRSAGPSSGARRAACVVQGAMEQLAPEAIGLGLGLGQSTQTVSAERRSSIVHAVGPRSMLVAPMDGQDFSQRVALQVAAGTVQGRQKSRVGDFVRRIRRLWAWSTRQRAAPSRTPALGTRRALLE